MNLILPQHPVDVEVTPEQVARVFTEMDSEQQALFFNEIAHIVKTEWDGSFMMQMQIATDDPALNSGGRAVMSTIGQYSKDV